MRIPYWSDTRREDLTGRVDIPTHEFYNDAMGVSPSTYVLPTPFIRYDSGSRSDNQRFLNSTLFVAHAATRYQIGNEPNLSPSGVVTQLRHEQTLAANTSIIPTLTSALDKQILNRTEGQRNPTVESVSESSSAKILAQKRVQSAYALPYGTAAIVDFIA